MTGSVIKGEIQREDIALYDGKTLAASRANSSGGTQTGTRVGNAVDVKTVYGNGSANVGAIQKAIDSLGTTNCALQFSPETWTIDANITIAANFTMVVPAGCVFAISSGVTLTNQGILFRQHATYKSGSGTFTQSGTDLIASVTQSTIFGTDSGTTDTYVVTTGIGASSLANGDTYRFEARSTNTGACTLKIDSTAAKSIKRFGTQSALTAGAIINGGYYTVVYDSGSDVWQLQTQPATSFIETVLDDANAAAARATLSVADKAGTETISGTWTFSATPTFSADLTLGDDLNMTSDDALISFGANSEISLVHSHNAGLNLKNKNTSASPATLSLQTGDTDIAAADILGKIEFSAPDEGTSGDSRLIASSIESVSEGDFSSSSNASSLVLKTGASEAATEKMRISSVGNVTMKNTATGDDTPMTLSLTTGETDIAAADILGKIEWSAPDEGTSGDSRLVAGAIECVSEGDFSSSSNSSKLSFRTGASETATEKMSLSSAGKLTVTGGSALGDAAGDAHTLTGTYAVNSNNVAVGNRMIFTSSGTFTKADDVPAHTTHVTVHCIGGGGGGGGGNSSTAKRGTGGGGGGYTLERLALSALSSDETVTIGAAGASGSTGSSPSAGGAGGTSSFGSHCSATGGGGGGAATGSAMGGSSGGTGSGGDLNVVGGSSHTQNTGTATSFGGNGAGPWGGGVAAANVGTSGNAYGGGGACMNHAAGDTIGAAGLVVVEW